MSPEQARSRELDPRTDLFSFGVVLYEMSTGRPAFGGNSSAEIFDAILNRPAVAPVRLNTDIPPDLKRILNKALEKDLALRYQHASEIRADLQRLKRDTDSGRTMAVYSSASARNTAFLSPASASQVIPARAKFGRSLCARSRQPRNRLLSWSCGSPRWRHSPRASPRTRSQQRISGGNRRSVLRAAHHSCQGCARQDGSLGCANRTPSHSRGRSRRRPLPSVQHLPFPHRGSRRSLSCRTPWRCCRR
jgi:serine/threonine protein kinase